MKIWKRYALCGLFVALLAGGMLGRGDFSYAPNRWRLWCDAFTVPGVLLLCAGALAWASSLGALDGLRYSLSLAVKALIPGRRLQKEESYGDYVARRRQNAAGGYGCMLISGGISVAISLLFLALYYLEG